MLSPISKPLQGYDQLYFVHIPKCAGTSFISLVDEHFINAEICPIHYDLPSFVKLTSEQLDQYSFIRGHLPYDLLIPRLFRRPRIITFLRNPVIQFISYFHMRQRVEDPLVGLRNDLQKLSMDDLLASPRYLQVFQNNATRILAGLPTADLLDYAPKTDLFSAKQHLDECEFIGITEEFEKSLELFCHVFGFPQPDQSRELNVSPDKQKRNEISDSTMQQIARVQEPDQELYDYGHRLFQQKYEQMLAERDNQPYFAPDVALRSQIYYNFQRVYPGMGWQVGEVHPDFGIVRWSGASRRSRIFLPIDKAGDKLIRFAVAAWASQKIRDSLRVLVNDVEISLDGRLLANSTYLFEGVIPASVLALRPTVSEICFEVAEVIRMSELDPSNPDSRELGLCYTWLLIRPV